MNKFFILFFLSTAVSLHAEASLETLIEYDKTTCLQQLESSSTAEVWDVFLKGQTELFAQPELAWIKPLSSWQEAKCVLEIGSGNGSYLGMLATQFPEKYFFGIEKLALSVEQANKRYAKQGICFQEADAENFMEYLSHSADSILFRLTLQHLKNPLLALEHAWSYLTPEGYVFIIDSCDTAHRTSHPIMEIQKALQQVAQAQKHANQGNRQITLDILKLLADKTSSLSQLYELVTSNLTSEGNPVCDSFRLEGADARHAYFNHSLLFITLIHRTYQIAVDMDACYDEIKSYLEDNNAWTTLGMHYLVLKKR